jgi:pilus assembly protein CpaE
MGQQDTPLDPGKERRLRLPAPLTVLAASEQIAALRAATGAPWIDSARLVPLELHEDITDAHLFGAGILVVHVDPAVPGSMDRVERVRALRPELPQIVALQSADVRLVRTLVRQGVADVVALPLSPEELLQVVIAVMEVQSANDGARAGLAPLVAVTRALGGGGATTLVTHLAASFADPDAGKPNVCLIDLDIQYGRVAEVLGLSPKRNLSDLLEAGSRLDDSLLRTVAAPHDSGVAIIAAPEDIVPLESIDTEQLRRTIELARQEFDFVFIDFPSNLTNWNLSILAEADGILMLAEQTIASLRQARRRLDLFRSVGIDRRIVSVVVNRMERRLFGTISLSDVAKALDHPVLCGLHADVQSIGAAQNQGVLVKQVRAKSAYAADVTKLAETLRQRLERGAGL